MTEGRIDARTRSGREAEVLAQIAIDNGLYPDWLKANKARPPALWRLMKEGKVRYTGMEAGRFRYALADEPKREGLWARIARRFTGGPAW